MPTLLGSITRAATRRRGEPLNILTFPTHEAYQTSLSLTGHNFYLVQGPGIKTWNTAYRPVPANHVLLDPEKGSRQVPADLDFDLVLSQNKFGQYPVAVQLSQQLHLPLVTLEHTLPMPEWSQGRMDRLRKLSGHIDVFISEYSRREWHWPETARVVHHGVNAEIFRPGPTERRAVLLSVVNDWKNRDWCCGFEFWREATTGLPTVVLGDTPGLSQPARSVMELTAAYRTARVFVNTSLISPVPSALLEAMASGCAVVSTATCMIPEIIEHEKNGLLADSPAEMRSACERLLADPQLAEKLGEAARQTVLQQFSLSRFVQQWNAVFAEAADIPYRGELH